MPVMTLNSVVLPAPFGPMIALRSPGMIFRVTSRVACKPPKLLHSPLSSSAGTDSPFDWVLVLTRRVLISLEELPEPRAELRQFALFAELAGREVAAIDRLCKELVFPVGPELTDVRVGLDHGVP